MNVAKTPVSAVEYFLRHPDKLKDLDPPLKTLFWDQRSWHPLVKMKWVAETEGGDGLITYPDGTMVPYEFQSRPNVAAP